MTIQQDLLQNYLDHVQSLVMQKKQSQQLMQDLTSYIDSCLKKLDLDPIYHSFFSGEQAFFYGKYHQALKLYAEAGILPNIEFFTLRAQAFLQQQFGQTQEAVVLAQQAIHLIPDDYITLHLLNLLAAKVGNKTLEQETLQKMELLQTPLQQIDSSHEVPVALTDSELNDFQDIFSSYQEEAFVPLNNFAEQNSKQDNANPGEEDWLQLSEKEFIDSPLFDFMLTQPLHQDFLEPEVTQWDERFSNGYFQKKLQEALSENLKEPAGQESMLEKRLQSFQEKQSLLMEDYTNQSHKHEQAIASGLYILNGWTFSQTWNQGSIESKTPKIPNVLLPEYYRKTSGGFYFKWNHKGVVVNPGMNFLQAFHQQNLYITDIDYVIITRDSMDSYADVKGIYDLNYQHNTMRDGNAAPHVINYYLNQEVFRNLSATLKPNFKQERHMLHGLELYINSPEEEIVSISEDIQLCYFQSKNEREQGQKLSGSALGVRLDLLKDKQAQRSIGFLLGIAWSPRYIKPLQEIDLLIAGFDKTNADDYNKLTYQTECLGYHGIYSLLTQAKSKLLLCCEFDGKDGDIRLEVVKKIRSEASQTETTFVSDILPGDTGCYLDLDQLQLRCSICKECVEPQNIHVIKSKESFGGLQYLCPSCLL